MSNNITFTLINNPISILMKNFNLLLIASLFILLGMTAFSQNKIEASHLTKEWTLLHSSNGVEMYIQYGECKMGNVPEPFQYGMIKLVNSSSVEKTIVYNIERHYTDGCVGCNMTDENVSTKVVPANTTITGNCENGNSVLIKNPLQTMFLDLKYLQLTTIKIN